LFAPGDLTVEELLALGRKTFPSFMARMTYAIAVDP